VPVNTMPEIERKWPAHLEPIKTAFGPVPNPWRQSRTFDSTKPPLTWRERRRIYLAGLMINGGRREEWRKSLRPHPGRRKSLDTSRGEA